MFTEKQTTSITIGDHTLVLFYRQYGEDFDVEDILRIDLEKLPMEMITFPVVLNRLGILLADANNELKAAEIDLEIYIAKRREEIRNQLINNRESGERMTVDDMRFRQEAKLKIDPVFKVKTQIVNKLTKVRDYVSSLFWSAKDKSEKLNFLASNLKSGRTLEDLIGEGFARGHMNGVTIKKSKPLIGED